MKKYYLKTGLASSGLLELDATNSLGARDEVQEVFVNGGKKTVVVKTYKLVSTKSFTVDTDY